jgi:hypothetical protein
VDSVGLSFDAEQAERQHLRARMEGQDAAQLEALRLAVRYVQAAKGGHSFIIRLLSCCALIEMVTPHQMTIILPKNKSMV